MEGRLPTSADWVLDKDELEGLFNEKTKSIIINTPNNPLGKVFTEEELTHIANLCKKWNTLCISDEVYEWIVYEPNKHIRIGNFWLYVEESSIDFLSQFLSMISTPFHVNFSFVKAKLLSSF